MGDAVATGHGPGAQGNTNTPSRASPKPWAPPAVIDDNSSAFARYATSRRASMGSAPPSRASSSALSSQGGSRQLGVTERMLAGQRLNSQRLNSQELPEYEPSEEMADDEEAPQGRRPARDARLPDMPMQRSASLVSRAHSADWLPHHMGAKSARRASTTERMLSGQRLESQRLASQELPEQDPSEELAEDDEPPPEQRRRSIGHPPTVPPDSLYRPRWARRQSQEAERPRQLPHILSGIELDMDLDAIQREGFEPAEDTIAEDPLKPSPFDAAKLDPFSSESEDEAGVHRPGGVRTVAQRVRSDADKTLAGQRLDAQRAQRDYEPSESLADDDEVPYDPAGHVASRKSTSVRPPKPVQKAQVAVKRQPSMTDRMLVGQKLNFKELHDDDIRRSAVPRPPSRAASQEMRLRAGSGGSCKLSVTDRMLSGQRLHSQRLASQHLPDYEPSEELADDYAAPSPIAAA